MYLIFDCIVCNYYVLYISMKLGHGSNVLVLQSSKTDLHPYIRLPAEVSFFHRGL